MHGTTGKLYCISCGAEYPAGAKFCGVDGSALTPNAPTGSNASGKICSGCRQSFPMYAQFCPVDGTRLSSAAVAQSLEDGTRAVGRPSQESEKFELPDEKDNTIVGRIFAGKYRIESLLGEGGMARVYKATHQDIEKPVVIKLMHPHLSPREKETSLKRFEQEMKISAQLNHPNLVTVYDGGILNSRPYLVMEYIKGESLRHYATKHGALPFDEAINIVTQMCAGLDEAHQQGIVHRDLKPENVMLREQSDRPDWVKIVDFGIAHLKAGGSKLTATGVAIGTVDYMSPEYLSDKPIDGRADVYAVGVILYELLTGKCPFESESCEAVMAKHLWTNPMPPSSERKDMVPGCALDVIVEKALEKEPDARYRSAADMQKALMAARYNKPAG